MDEKQRNVYQSYEKHLFQSQALDFSDLLFKTYELFQKHPEAIERYQEQFKYVMVDEYQDTNFIQYSLIKKIAIKRKNLCVVGDEDQSIYSWRGADYTNISNLRRDFQNVEIIRVGTKLQVHKNYCRRHEPTHFRQQKKK